MAGNTTNGAPILRPEDVGNLLVTAVGGISIAFQVSTVVTTKSHDYRIPIQSADPAAGWFAEGAEITPADATFSELDVTPSKVAGLSIISRELAEDSDPAAAQTVGNGLARDIARKVDAAWFANTTTNGPAGLASLTTSTAVEAGSAFANLDPFAEAISKAEIQGAKITAFVTSPAEALALAKLKQATGSNLPLLGADPTSPTRRTVFGVPLYVAPDVPVKTAWAIAGDRSFIILRDNTRVEVDRSVKFTSDQVAVKATMRVGFGFPQPLALVKITHA